tara:strand:- start:14277 stop:15377 length:1101 start_codon:yes stop_codon:yes gene_type:complete
MLGDLGADIIKVEAPEGDQFRYTAKPSNTRGMSPGFMALNDNKRSIVLDLKQESDRGVMRELIAAADIFIHNIRPEAIARLGFGPDEILARWPALIYVHCVGFGASGPYAGLQAYDDVIQAATGASTLSGRVDGTKAARYIPSLIADKVAGLYGAQAALAAYIHKLRTGQGQFIEVPMFETFAHFMLVEHLGGLTFDPPNAPVCYPRQIDPDRQPFPTKDGYISIVPYTPQSWATVFRILEDETFLEQDGLQTVRDQFLNQSRLYQRLAELTPQRETADWVSRFRAARIPCMPVRDMAEILEDPHLLQTGFFNRRSHQSEGEYFEMRPPVRYSAYSKPELGLPPRLGEHTSQIRSEVGHNTGHDHD